LNVDMVATNALEEKAIPTGSVNNTAHLNSFGFDNIKHEVLVNNKHSVTEFLEPFIFRNHAKEWV